MKKKDKAISPSLEIYYNRWKCMGWFLLYFVCFYIFGIILFFTGHLAAGIILGFVFALPMIQNLFCIFYHKPGIILNKEGVTLNRPFRCLKLRWDEICGFSQMSYQGCQTSYISSRVVILHLRNQNEFLKRQNLFKRFCFILSDKILGSCVRFSFNAYKYDYSQFLTDLETAPFRFK